MEEDGALRFTGVGGTDLRTVPNARVIVHAPDGPLPGVIGALPPHLLTAKDIDKMYKWEDLYIDVGLPSERVRDAVPAGTMVSLDGSVVRLQNGRISSKALDDRAGIAVMLRAAQLLSNRKYISHVTFVAASQEEVGSRGIHTAAYALNPDIAVAIDVTLAKMAKEEPGTFPLDTVVATAGPFIHPKLHQYLLDTAKAEHVAIQRDFASSGTGTDADDLQVTHSGVPTVLIELPLSYMHTPVEVLCESTLEEAARLLTAFITGLDEKEEGWLCNWTE